MEIILGTYADSSRKIRKVIIRLEKLEAEYRIQEDVSESRSQMGSPIVTKYISEQQRHLPFAAENRL